LIGTASVHHLSTTATAITSTITFTSTSTFTAAMTFEH
jgi:hypothetical protein